MTTISSTSASTLYSPRKDDSSAPAVITSNPQATRESTAVIISLSASGKAAIATGAQKDFATVAKDARATLDAGYQKLGKTADIYTTEDDWRTAFGGMDRRSLYAVASNEGGQFTKIEQDMAHSFMAQQQAAAMGMDSVLGMAAFASDPAAGYKGGVAFFDGVSAEEKGSWEWAEQRAAMQYGYESAMRQKGQEPENLDSDNPLVRMIKGAMAALAATNDPSKRIEDMPQYKQAREVHASGATSSSKVDKTV